MEEQIENEIPLGEQNQEEENKIDDNQDEKIIDINNLNDLSLEKEKNENPNDIPSEKKEEEKIKLLNDLITDQNDNNKEEEKNDEINIEEKTEEKKEENIEEKKDENLEEKKEENIGEKKEENIEEKKDENIEEKKDENVEEKKDENIEEKKEENIEEKKDENVEEKKEENIEEKKDENTEGKKDENLVEKKDENIEEKKEEEEKNKEENKEEEKKVEEKNEEKKVEEENKDKEIDLGKSFNGIMIKEPNKEPDLGPNDKSQLNPSIHKLKNKNLDETITAIIKKEDENSKEERKNNENKLFYKLNEFNYELNRKAEINNFKIRKNNIDFHLKSYDGKNNRYQNYTNSNGNLYKSSNYNLSNIEPMNLNEKKFNEIKNKKFLPDKLYSSLNDNYFKKCDFFSSKPKDNYMTDFSQSLKLPNRNDNKSNYKYYYKPLVYTKNVQNIKNGDKRRDDIYRIINSNDNFENILKKIKPNNFNNFEENKNKYNYNNLLYSSNGLKSYKNYCNNDSKKNSKIKNLMKEVYNEIQDKNYSSLKSDFIIQSTIMQSKMKLYPFINKYNNTGKDELKSYLYKTPDKTKNKNMGFNDLLRYCSKENLKKSQSSKKKYFLF